MSISGRVGSVSEHKTSSGSVEFEVTYFVKNADLADYIPEIGELADWAPETAYVTDYRKEGIGDDWMLYIISAPSSSELTSLDVAKKPTPEALQAFIQKNYSQSEVLFRKEWFGVRIADIKDIKKDDGGEPRFQDTLGNHYMEFLNIDGGDAKVGDWIFNNATPKRYYVDKSGTVKNETGTQSKGSAVYTRAPYDMSDTKTNLKAIERSVKTLIYTVTYYTPKSVNSIGPFLGFSGDFPSGMSPNSAVTYKWKAIDQSFENIKDTNGTIWTRVTRKMEAAPSTLLWVPERDLYNYAWTW